MFEVRITENQCVYITLSSPLNAVKKTAVQSY